jgi:hypothetical protein
MDWTLVYAVRAVVIEVEACVAESVSDLASTREANVALRQCHVMVMQGLVDYPLSVAPRVWILDLSHRPKLTMILHLRIPACH